MISKEDVISFDLSQEDTEVGTKRQREIRGNWLVVRMAHMFIPVYKFSGIWASQCW